MAHLLKFFFLTIVLILSLRGLSQDKMGFKAGVSVVDLVQFTRDGSRNVNVNSSGNNFRLSYHGGFQYIFEINDVLGFSTEVLYSNKGERIGFNTSRNGIRYHLHFFTLPLVFVYSPIQGLDIEAGVEGGFLLAARNKGRAVSSNSVVREVNYDALDDYNRLDGGIVVGLAHQFSNGISISARLVYGLANINNLDDFNNNTITNPVRIQTRTTMFSVGYNFAKN